VETFTFHGYWGAQSKCGLDILRRPDGTAWVMLTEVPDNKGTSITNAFEYLATLIKRTWLGELPPEAITLGCCETLSKVCTSLSHFP